MKMHQQANIMRKCLDIAFENSYQLSKLSDAELAALIELQHSLWWERILISYLLNDYTDKSEEFRKKCQPAINEALNRLTAEGGMEKMTAFSDALLPILRHFDKYSKKIEALFVAYIQEALTNDTLSSQEEISFASIFAHLYRFHISYDNPDYKFTVGEEKAKQIIAKWLSEFDSEEGWKELPLKECLRRIDCFQDYYFQSCFNCPWQKSNEIFWFYLDNINSYPQREYCQAVGVRAINMDNAEKPFAEKDLQMTSSILLSAETLETRLIAAYAIIKIFNTLYIEEATAMTSMPEGTRSRYAEVLNAINVSALTDSELMRISKLANFVINTLEQLEDEHGFFVENLQIVDVARQICNELIVRGKSNMLKLAKEIGYGDSAVPEVKKDWAVGGEENVQAIVNKALSIESANDWTDTELVYLAHLLKAISDNKEKLEFDEEKLEKAIMKCFAPLWSRINTQQGNPLTQFEGIKQLFSCMPLEAANLFSDPIEELEKSLVESLLKAKETRPEFGLSAIEVAISSPLCQTVFEGFHYKYKNTIGMDYFRQEVAKWADELEQNGYWPGLNLEDAFRCIRVFQNDTLRSVENVDYPWVITNAFNHYIKQVIEIEENSSNASESKIKMYPCSIEGISLIADCYFALADPQSTDLMPAHFIRYCMSCLEEELHGNYCWLFYSIILRAHLLQDKLLEGKLPFDPNLN